MDIVSILYVFLLFYVFTPGTVITLPFKGSKIVHCLIHTLLFSIMLFLTYDIVNVTEGMKNKDKLCNKCKSKDYCELYKECIAENPEKPCRWKRKMCKRCNKHCDNTTTPAVKQTFKIYENNTNNYLLAEPHSSGMAISKTAQSDLATKFYFDSQSFPGFILISTSDDTMFLRLFGKLSSDSKTPEQTSFINSSNASTAKQQLGNITTTNIVDHANIFSYLGVQYNMTATTAPATTAPATTRPATIKPIDIAPVFSSHRIGGCAGTEEGCSASHPFGPNFASFF